MGKANPETRVGKFRENRGLGEWGKARGGTHE